jgi:hypothetical protein
MYKEKDIVRITVREEAKQFYYPSYLTDCIGYVWQFDDEHIYIKSFERDINGVPFISSISRYPLYDVTVEVLDLK